MTLGRQVPDASRSSSHSPSASASAGRSRKKCWVSTKLRRLAVDLRARVDQVGRVELVAAVVALVAARLAVPADRAGALDVAVRQGAAGRRADRAVRRLLDHVAVAVHGAEHLLHTWVVVARRGAREQVVGQPEVEQVLDDDRVVLVGQVARRSRPALSAATRIGVPCSSVPETMSTSWPGHPHVAAEHVGGHTETGHVADVARAVGVRPGDGGQDMGHGVILGGGCDGFPAARNERFGPQRQRLRQNHAFLTNRWPGEPVRGHATRAPQAGVAADARPAGVS